MLQGVLFDMDGVLLDTERLYMEADRQAARQLGLPQPSQALLVRMCGANDASCHAMLCEHYGPGFDCDAFNAIARQKVDAWTAGGRLRLMPGVEDTLAWLGSHGYRLAVATSCAGDVARRLLAQGGLLPCFAAVVSGDMVQNGKPDPEIYQSAAAALGLAPAQCAAVEDSFAGVRSAAAAGCFTVMVPDQLQPTTEIRALCDAVLPHMHELPALLERCSSTA